MVYSEFDDTDIFGGEVDFDDETSVRGRLGLRLGFDHLDDSGTVISGDVTASVWEEFSGDNDVAIIAPGLPGSLGASDDPGATVGDVSLGLSVADPEGISGFLRGDYQFAEDYEAIIGNAGVRSAWSRAQSWIALLAAKGVPRNNGGEISGDEEPYEGADAYLGLLN